MKKRSSKRHISARIGAIAHLEIIETARAERTSKSEALGLLLADGLRWRMLEGGVSRKFLSELADKSVETEFEKFVRALEGAGGFRFEPVEDGSLILGPNEILFGDEIFYRKGRNES